MKTAIVYFSKHHDNTKKVLDFLCEKNEITLIDAASSANEKLDDYDAIGFASGIYYSKFDKSVLTFAKNNLPENKDVFFIYTCGAKKDTYTKAIKSIAEEKFANVLGEYGCLGFDSYGPFKLIGGIAKGHPDEEELKAANEFYNGIIK